MSSSKFPQNPEAALSNRLRPECEAAPWVIEEVKKYEATIQALSEKLAKARGALQAVVGPYHIPFPSLDKPTKVWMMEMRREYDLQTAQLALAEIGDKKCDT
jgi:hypothetical protein